MFLIQKQDSTRSSASGSNTNREVDKNSDTVNLAYTKATRKRKISNVSPSPNPEKSVLSVEADKNNLTSTLATLAPVGVELSPALSTSNQNKSQLKGIILVAKICHLITLIVILMYFQTLCQIVPQEIILKTFKKHAILSQNLLFFTNKVLRTFAQHTNSYG